MLYFISFVTCYHLRLNLALMPVTNKLVDSEGKLSVVNVDVVECMILRLLLMTQLSDMASRMVLENTRLNTTTKFERAVVCTLTFFVNNGFQADVSTAALDLQCCGPNGENEIQQSWNSVHCFIVFVPDLSLIHISEPTRPY